MKSAKLASSKGYRASVVIEEYRGKYRLYIVKKYSDRYYGGKQKRIYTNLNICEENLAAVESTATRMHLDLVVDSLNPNAANAFDPSLKKYGLARPELTVIETLQPKSEPTLMEIWDKWLEYGYETLKWEVKTKSQYKTFTNHIKKIPTELLHLDRASEARKHIINTLSPDIAKRLLTRINAAMKFARENGLISRNPYEGMANKIKIQVKSEDEEVDPLTAEERDLIISSYEAHPEYKKYAAFVKMLFWTGARHSEIIGLRWSSIEGDVTNFEDTVYINIKEAIVYCEGKSFEKTSTKNKKGRKFRATNKVKALLKELKNENVKPEDLFFSRQDGSPINHSHFQRSWRGGDNGNKKYHGIVTILVEKGLLSHYRNPYQTRHTFATLALENGMEIHDIARIIGNTARVCVDKYVKSRRDLIIPEF